MDVYNYKYNIYVCIHFSNTSISYQEGTVQMSIKTQTGTEVQYSTALQYSTVRARELPKRVQYCTVGLKGLDFLGGT